MSQELQQLIPGLKQAIERETAIREQSFLSFPESICGIEVQPLTLRKMLLLSATGSPFIIGGAVTPYQIGVFFLTLTEARGFRRWLLLRRVGSLKLEATVEAIKAFLDESFQDSPPSRGGDAVSYYSFAAAIVDVFASEYGWSREQILDEPLKSLFQYLKAITKRNNPDAIQFNPSGRIICKYLEEQNALAGRN